MLKADLNRLIALASDDESVRIAAARQLASLPRYHFEDHAVETYRLPDGWADAMAAAWHATSSDAVRAWIAQGVVLADPWPRKAIEPLAAPGRECGFAVASGIGLPIPWPRCPYW